MWGILQHLIMTEISVRNFATANYEENFCWEISGNLTTVTNNGNFHYELVIKFYVGNYRNTNNGIFYHKFKQQLVIKKIPL